MSEYIECRSCPSPSCKGCNIYSLATMLRRGAFDCLMNGNRSINPTADVVEVKHGEWVKRPNTKGQVYCSECATLEEITDNSFKSNYCPNCGADMRDGGADNG